MANDYEERLLELLEAAATWPVAEWEQRARTACEDGAVSAAELLRALSRDADLEGFLDRPAWATSGPPDSAAGAGHLGRQIGRYRLLETLGHGGMGQVFLAEQAEPERRVALKLIRDEALSAAAVERFRAEQRAIARLNHPHIAQFLEAALTDDGQPYFAMEWVDGLPIDRFVQGRGLDLQPRLRLFLEVCGAVHYAHQRQVVHRDLKPGNILVREIDGRPVAKVIDFGIAEALDRPVEQRESKPTRGSSSGSVYGTPVYLSPESFEGDVDTRADIYSLGVLLYQLVTGVRPFGEDGLRLAELIERIQRGDKESASRAALRGVGLAELGDLDRRRWARQIRGDLEAVIDKAMHPDRTRRYGTAAELAADVERFLAEHPVEARVTGVGHHLRLLFRRRRVVVLAVSVAVLSLLLGSIAATLGLLQARHEAEVAHRALEESEALAGFLTALFEQSDPSRVQGEEITARELLDQGMERLATELQDQPLLRANFTRTVGDIYATLGYYQSGEALLLESLALFEEVHGRNDPEVVRALQGLGVLKGKAGEPEAARGYFLEAQTLEATTPGVEPIQKALTSYHLGVLSFRDGDLEEAARHFDIACAGPEVFTGQEELQARCLEGFGALRVEQNRLEEAERLYLRSLHLRQRILGPEHLHVASSFESLCFLHSKRHALAEADGACRRALEIRRRNLGDDHSEVVRTLSILAPIRRLQGDYDGAEGLFLQALTFYQEDPSRFAQERGAMLIRLAWVSWLQGELDEAEERYRRALDLASAGPAASAGRALTARLGIGLVLWKQGRLDEAERELAAVHAIHQEHFGNESQRTAWTAWGLAGVYRDRARPGDFERAEPLYQLALEVRRRGYGPGHEYLRLTEEDYREFLGRRGEGAAR